MSKRDSPKDSEKSSKYQKVVDSGGGEAEKNRIKESAKESSDAKHNDFVA